MIFAPAGRKDIVIRDRRLPGMNARGALAARVDARPAAVLVAAAFFLLMTVATAMAAPDVGKTSIVVRSVRGTLATQVRDLVLDDLVFQNEVVETGEKSASEIRLLDETRISVGANSKLVLDKFVYDPSPGKGRLVLNVTEGVFRFISGSMPSEAYRIETPTATIGVRGTVFYGVILSDGYSLYVLQSPGGLNVRTSIDAIDLDRPGAAVLVSPDGSLMPVQLPQWARWRFEGMESLLASVRPWNPPGGPSGPGGSGSGNDEPQRFEPSFEGGGPKGGDICVRC